MSKSYKNVQIGTAPKYGKRARAVFADEDISAGEVIAVFSGDIISFDECIERIRTGKEEQADSLQVGFELDMDLDRLSNSFNHSCDPNAGHRKISELIAIRDIRRGDEITYDYSATIGPNVTSGVWTMECSCGTKKCRKIISNVLSIPKKQLEKYQKAGTLQDYIKRELEIIRVNGGIPPKYKKIKI